MPDSKTVSVTFDTEDDAHAFVVWARYAFDHYLATEARELSFEERREARRVFGAFNRAQ